MKKWTIIFILLPLLGYSHPGIGIVKDSKGNIFFTDLKQVWRIYKGKQTVAVPNVHTHELYIDRNDNLYGENLVYEGDAKNRFSHYMWVLTDGGVLDTVVSPRQAYVHNDFSLAKDIQGNEYFLKPLDSIYIYKKFPNGKEVIYSKGNFKGIKWLHPQRNGSLLFVSKNNVYKIDSAGKISLIKHNVGNPKPSFKFSGNSITVWGVWEDNAENIYVAVFSDQTVKKIDAKGNITNYYTSSGNWTPTQGILDNDNQMWILECSDKNEIRAVLATPLEKTGQQIKNFSLTPYFFSGFFIVGLLVFYFKNKAGKKRRFSKKS